MDWARNAVKANASVVRLLVPAHTTTNVTVASITVIANASVVRLLVPARTTTNVDRERNAVKANASEVRPLVIREFKIRSLRTTDYGNTRRGPGSRFTAHAR